MNSVSELLRALVKRLLARRGELEREMFARARDVVGPPEADLEYGMGFRAAVGSILEYGFAAIGQGEAWADMVPLAALDQARLAARSGVPLATVMRRYVAGAAVLTRFVLEEVGQLDAPSERQLAVSLQALASQFSLLDRLLAQVTQAYEQASDSAGSSAAHRRARLVARVLSGEPVDASALGYDLAGAHLGVIVDGPSSGLLIRRLAQAIGRPALVIDQDDETAWGWLGGRRVATRSELPRALKRVSAPDGAILALGEPATGAAGFRDTHRQAQEAVFVARRAGRPPLVRYAEVAVVAHALKDDDFARSLLAIYLTPLDRASDSAALRQTLRAYLTAAGNATAAAAALSVSERTVRRRLSLIEEQVGRPLYSCRSEIELALRLEELLAAETQARTGAASLALDGHVAELRTSQP
jgi:hypothetical protein